MLLEGPAHVVSRCPEAGWITTVQAAEALDVRRPAISELEHGKRKVSAEELGKLADLYGVSVTWLLGRASNAARDSQRRYSPI
ncbi:MAG: helix-turn-helix transcriptional regulator [Actinobacteria bacterium]|nr:helix-turn-helix transcriptional regulator [Actinomycetota bacterium]